MGHITVKKAHLSKIPTPFNGRTPEDGT